MVGQYDAIADQYRRTTRSPLRTYVEAYTLLGLIGGVEGLDVLDLGCGEGFYARRLKRLGAARVVGVDASAAMIELAKAEEATADLGIQYVCADVRDLPPLGQFELVVAAYLLHYAPDETALLAMARNIVRHLAPGGRFVALNENPDQRAADYRGYDQYGFNKSVALPRKEGSTITYAMVAGRELFRFQAYFYGRATYERVLRAAGLHEITWHPLVLDPAGMAAHGEAYWQEYLANPPVVALEARV